MRIILGVWISAVSAFAQLQITTSSVPVATQYQSYNTTLTAIGGTPPYTWSVVSSTNVSLPEGMSLNPVTGVVSAATVNGQGGYTVTVQVTDNASPHNTATATLDFGVYSAGSFGGCQMFPPDSIYNQRIDQLPVDHTTSHQIPSGYLGSRLHPDFGHGFYPDPGGIPFTRVPANQPLLNVNLPGDSQIDGAGTYPWPFPAWPNTAVEGTSYGPDGPDHHILVLQTSVNSVNGPQTGACTLYETYSNTPVPGLFDAGSNTWFVSAGLHYSLGSNEIAASADTLDNGAQDSAGVPMVPLLIQYSEVPLGVHHPLRITFPGPTNWFVWPATGCCNGSGPPQGLLYRLKAGVNWQAVCPASTNPQAATLLQALQQYGAYMSDHGSAGYVQGAPDIRWDDNDLHCVTNFHVSDLEVVDNSMLEVSDLSGQTQPYVAPATLAGGTVGTAYSATIGVVGGNPSTLSWLVKSGALPTGLTLSASTGIISGTPGSITGSPFTFSIAALDSASGYSSASQTFSIAVTGPGLTVAKSHSGNFMQGQNGAAYSVTVTNDGTAATSGTVTVTETIPPGLTLVSMAGGGWNCPSNGNTCSRSDALGVGASYSAITVTVNVSPTAASQVINQVGVAGGGSGSANAQDTTSIVGLATQTISFGALSNVGFGNTFSVSATASSGLPVSFTSQTPLVCTTSTVLQVGTCTIQASQGGNSNWAAATPVDQSFQVTLGSQTISFGALPNVAFGNTFSVSATASSGQTVSFSSLTPLVCTTSTVVAVGTCTIHASQAGTTNWAAATPVDQSFQVTLGSQTISFGALPNVAFGNTFSVSATASSGQTVSFSSLTPLVCTTSTVVAVGTCTIHASQAGTTNWAAATPVDQSFQVTLGSQTITFGALPNVAFGNTFSVSATASSGQTVSFSSLTPLVCTTSTVLAVGTCTIRASQAGTTNWAAATPVDQSFQVTLGSQTITFGTLPNVAFGNTFSVGATASSGQTVSFSSLTPLVCTTSTVLAVGTCTIRASQAGTTNWAAATPVDQSFQVTLGSQTISFGALPNVAFGNTFSVSATASSGQTVSFSSLTPLVCTTSTVLAVGTCTIRASQAGTTNWAAATLVDQSFQVTLGSQTISFGALPNVAFGNTFSVSATASSGQTVSFSSLTPLVCTTSSVLAVGTCTIRASQSGTTNWAAATPVDQSFQVTLGSQTISFGALPNVAFGNTFSVSATASSGQTVSFSSLTPLVCTTSTVVAVGTCTIHASQAGTTNWAAATPVDQSFQVTLGSQTISFGALPNVAFGNTFSVSATASSGQTVSFSSLTPLVCTTSTVLAVGTCTIHASQAGTTNWAAATPVDQSFQVTLGSQTISFGALPNVAFGNTFSVSATASSGQTVSFSSLTPLVCTTSTVLAVGTCTIRASQAGTTNWAAATPVDQSFQVTLGSQTISFGALPNVAFGNTFSASATASSGQTVSFSSLTPLVCTTSTVLAVGTCTIRASQAGTTNWAAATPVDQSFQVTLASQTISFGALPNVTFGNTFSVSATASSGQTVSFSSLTPLVCTTSTVLAVGTCTIRASQAGTTNWAAATPVDQSFQVTLGSQTITFGTLPNVAFGNTFSASATASSGQTVSFSSLTPLVCTTSTVLAVGTCTIRASQAGTTNWAAATPVDQSFQVTLGSQTISFGALPNVAFGNTFSVSATASSGQTVSFSSLTPLVCTTSTVVAVGTCTIRASQAGTTNWAAATPVDQSFKVTLASQTISFGALPNVTFGNTFSVSATASSGQTVSFSSLTPLVCTTSSVLAVGTCTIRASQSGTTNWAAATPVDQSFQVTLGSQTISFGALPNVAFGNTFSVSATASSGQTVSFSSLTPLVCTTSTVLAVGTCTIRASQAGTTNWAAATLVDQSFQVTLGSQTITFGTLPNVAFGNTFSVSATASSGQTVSFSSLTPLVCTTSTVLAAGTCMIRASQGGNTNWAAAAPVDQSFQVTQASQTITFGALPNVEFGNTFTLTATASSGQPVTFSSLTPLVCTTSTVLSVGTCTIHASQSGTTNWAAAMPVDQSFQIIQASQTINFAPLPGVPLGNTFTLTATASSNLPVTFTSLTPSVCTASALLTIGTCTIEASQAGNSNWTAAVAVDQSFLVTAGIATPSAGALAFPNTIAGKTSAAETLTLENTGNAPLTIASIQLAGPDAVHYQYTADAVHPCPLSPATLAPGAVCGLDVIFAPQSQGPHNNAQLVITNNHIALSGTGIVLSSIAVTAGSATLAYGNSEPFIATGTYSDGSTGDFTMLAAWNSTAPGVAAISPGGLASAGTAGQTSITAAAGGLTSNVFQLTVVAGSPATISAVAGSGQSATVRTPFAAPLAALVKDSGGNPVPNIAVTFTAPSSGPSATFVNGSASCTSTTNASGVATSLPLTANGTAGNYMVDAGTAGFALSNLPAPLLTVTVSHTLPFAQGESGAAYTLTVTNAAGAGPTSGTVTVTEALPAGLTLAAMSGGPTWNCATLPTCTTSAVLAGGTSYPPLAVVVNVAANAPATLINQVLVSGGASAMAGAGDTTAIVQISPCNVMRTGNTSVSDLQMIIDEAMGTTPPAHNLNGGSGVSVVDVQIVMNAVLGLGCGPTLP